MSKQKVNAKETGGAAETKHFQEFQDITFYSYRLRFNRTHFLFCVH